MYIVTCHALEHRGEERLFLHCENSPVLNVHLKQLPGIKWSKTHKQWHVPLQHDSYRKICTVLKGIASVDSSLLKIYLQNRQQVTEKKAVQAEAGRKVLAAAPNAKQVKPGSGSNAVADRIAAVNQHVLPALRQYLVLKAYSAATARTYTQEVTQFLYALKNNAADDFDAERIKKYLQYCFETLHLGEHTVHSRMNALKFYYEQVLGREKFLWEIPRPKKPLQLPRFFNQEEVAAIINTTANAKHKTMLMLCYSTGMRVSEVVRLKTRNIDSKRMCILVEQAKGKKDRMAPLSPVLLVMLRAYSLAYKPSPTGYLFEGQEEGSPYSTRGLQEVLHAAKQRALVYKPGGVHSLRHSFATHLLDKGTDISMIQKLLGHNDIKTTLRYLHTTNKDIMNIVSPLDSLNLT